MTASFALPSVAGARTKTRMVPSESCFTLSFFAFGFTRAHVFIFLSGLPVNNHATHIMQADFYLPSRNNKISPLFLSTKT